METRAITDMDIKAVTMWKYGKKTETCMYNQFKRRIVTSRFSKLIMPPYLFTCSSNGTNENRNGSEKYFTLHRS